MRCQLGRIGQIGLIALLVAVVGACGDEIGDECQVDADCSTSGDRTCIDATANKPGYCTIRGCDFDTCPDEAACIRFFSGSFENRTCDPMVLPEDCTPGTEGCCSLDELCAVSGQCVPRSSEIRYCMRTCDSDGDCRGGYECRDLNKMIDHGGEPVPAPGEVAATSSTKFCAVAGS